MFLPNGLRTCEMAEEPVGLVEFFSFQPQNSPIYGLLMEFAGKKMLKNYVFLHFLYQKGQSPTNS